MCDAEEYDDDDGDDHDGHGASTHTADSTTASELESMMTTTGFREKRPVRSLSFGAWTCRLFRGAGLGGSDPKYQPKLRDTGPGLPLNPLEP